MISEDFGALTVGERRGRVSLFGFVDRFRSELDCRNVHRRWRPLVVGRL